jgi:hypothetical protein
MRGRIIKFRHLSRREQAKPETFESGASRKPWLFRVWDKTAAPFWFARVRRKMRHSYRNWVTMRFYLGSRMNYRLKVHGIKHFKYRPSTIIACGHKRDMDIPLVIPVFFLFQRPSRLKYLRLLYVAARDDVFEDGFLMNYFPLLDQIRPVLARLSVKRIFDLLQACPVKLPDEQTVNQLLHETRRIEGNLAVSEAFDEEWQRRLLGENAGKPDLTLSDVIYRAPLEVLAQYATPRMFREPLATRIRQRHATTMVQQLRTMTRILEKGGMLLVLPQGQVTPDGRFSKMRAAITRLVLQTRAETTLLPTNITYDFMDTIRPSVTVLIGPEVTGLKHHTKNELAEIIREKVARLSCVTLGGLASRWLVAAANQGVEQVELSQMREEIWTEVQRLKEPGLYLDQQLQNRKEFDRRFNRFLQYARIKGGIFIFDGKVSRFNPKQSLTLNLASLQREECQNPDDNPVRYCYNELTELLEIYQALPEAEAAQQISLAQFKPKTKRTGHLTAG